jgi:MFS family permease
MNSTHPANTRTASPQTPDLHIRVTSSHGYAWYVASVLSLAYCFSFIDRQILNLLVVPIQADLAISDTQMSLLQGFAFALFYTLMGLPLGRVADRWSRKGLILIGVAVWSAATVACGFATSFGELFVARVWVGIGEAVLTPAALSLLSDYFPRDRLARAAGLYSSGSSLGAVLAYMVGGSVLDAVTAMGQLDLPWVGPVAPWHATFILVGLPGLLLIALVASIREPERKGTLKVAGRVTHVPFLDVVRYILSDGRAYVPIYLGLAMQVLLTYAIHSWMPAFLMRVHEWTPTHLGMMYGLVLLFGSIPGLMLGGWLGDVLVGRGRSNGHVLVAAWGCALSVVPAVVAPLLGNPYWTMVLMAVANFFFSFAFGTGPAALQVITPNQMRGQISAIYVLVVGLIGLLLGPSSVAVLTDYVFEDRLAVGMSISVVAAVVGPASAVFLAAALGPYRQSVRRAAAWD